jgi:hypothetical protein
MRARERRPVVISDGDIFCTGPGNLYLIVSMRRIDINKDEPNGYYG